MFRLIIKSPPWLQSLQAAVCSWRWSRRLEGTLPVLHCVKKFRQIWSHGKTCNPLLRRGRCIRLVVNHSGGSVNYICEKVGPSRYPSGPLLRILLQDTCLIKNNWLSILLQCSSTQRLILKMALQHWITPFLKAKRQIEGVEIGEIVLLFVGGTLFFRACGSEEKKTLLTEVSEVTVAWLP